MADVRLKNLFLAALTLVFGLWSASFPAQALQSFAEVKADYKPSFAWLLDRYGRPLQSLRVDMKVRRLEWTRLADVSPALVKAVVASEDKHFFDHAGVDWRAAGSAAWHNLLGGRVRGASTLTMQLAGLLEEDAARRGRRSVWQKLGQTSAALRLEGDWNKKQILEAYLNLVPFRGELQGVAAMSRTLFGKWPDGLTEQEAALAAALLRSPNTTPAVAAKRACGVLKELGRDNECEGLDALAALTLGSAGSSETGLRGGDGDPALAPHLARRLLNAPGQRLRSSLDAGLQAFAGESLRRHLSTLAKQNAEDGAVIVLDNASGQVLAWVGSSGELSSAAEVDGVTALRQPGSTLKPFLYALAFERRVMTPASLVDDAPLALDTGNGLYAPADYEPDYRGWVSVRAALGGSLNVPAVKTLVRLGPDAFHRRLKALGFESLKESGDYYGYSLALGSADVSLLMLANAYRSLANGGRWSPLRVTPGTGAAPLPCREGGCEGAFGGNQRWAVAPGAAFLAADILADRTARAGTFGLDSWLATPYWAAAKTGTSKDMRDNWCAGFSRRYTVAVWVGNAEGSPMHDVSGVSGAAPVWREVMDWLQRGDPRTSRPKVASLPPLPPVGVVARNVRFEPPREPPRREWFLSGTEMSLVKAAPPARALARIAYPAEGMVVALDPDIPPRRQRLPLRLSAPAGAGWQWRLDGLPLGKVGSTSLWLPQPGRHRLAVEDAGGREVDAVAFEVRALKAKR